MPAEYGSLPFGEQIRFFRQKKPVPTARWDDLWQSAHDQGFMVAGAIKADLLRDLQSAVKRGIEGGSYQQFVKEFDAIVAAHGWTGWTGSDSAKGRAWRTKVIYETNLRTSYAAGRWEQIQANKAHLPWLQYKHSDSVQHPRPLHLSWDGLILHADDPWWQTHAPPNGWGCKCRVVAMSDAAVKRRKLKPGTPPDDGTDPKTGAPKGIDKGWDYAPGASRPEQLGAQFRAKAQKLPPDIKAGLLRDIDRALGRKVTPPPAPPAPVAALSETFSTVKGVTGEGIAEVIDNIPGAEAQVERLRAFLAAHPIKTLVLKQNEIGDGKAAQSLISPVFKFLKPPAEDITPNTLKYKYTIAHRTRRPASTNGFTAPDYEHVVVKAKAADRVAKTNPAELAEAVEAAIARAPLDGKDKAWSLRAALDVLTGEKRPGLASTWAHEIGHQVHYWAGSPQRPLDSAAITRYSTSNKQEWHAEHFAAWLFNRDALAQWSPEIAAHIDELIERATAETKKWGYK